MRRIRRFPAVMISRVRARIEGLRSGVSIAPGVRFGRGVRCTAASGGRVILGPGVEVGAGTGLTAGPGATLELGERVFVSGGCTIAATGRLHIGAESMIGELVSIRDHDHDPAHPPRSGHLLQSDVIIGPRVWLGAKSSVVRGATIGADAVVGAHALVNRPVEAASLAVGVPARVVRRNLRPSPPDHPGGGQC